MQNNNSLAKISLAINALLVIAVIILFTRGNGGSETAEVSGDDSTSQQVIRPNDGELKIGYFNTDSLNSQLLMIKDLEQEMADAQKNAEDKMQKEQNKIDSWNKKWEARMPLLSGEQDVYQKEMQKMQQDAMIAEQTIQMELAQSQEMIMYSHIQRISNFSKIYAEKNGFDMIMSYQIGQNPIYIHPSMDVTAGVVKLMNDDYNSMFSGDVEEEEQIGEE